MTTPPLHTLRWGIASAGRISNDFSLALSTLPAENHKIVAVAARNESSAKDFAETFNIPKYYEGYEKLAADTEVGMEKLKWTFCFIIMSKDIRNRSHNVYIAQC
jgi:hypothetical protein